MRSAIGVRAGDAFRARVDKRSGFSSAEIPEAKVVKSAPVDDETAAAVKAAAAAAGDAPAS